VRRPGDSDPRPAGGRGPPRLVLTSGEPAGVGPELCAQALARARHADCELTVLGDSALLAERAALAGVRVPERILHEPLAVASVPGRLDVANAPYVLSLLDRALAGIAAGRFDAMVTAPVHKGVVNDAGVAFTGHTEYLAARTGCARPVMLLVAGRLRVALATTHLPLAAVSAAITRKSLESTIGTLDTDLRRRWGLARPRIGVLGLNPHAGEAGHLGREEIETISPAIDACRRRGIDATGPVPADTAFVPREAARYDAILAMYHDQGLPVLKHVGFGHAVNVTLGLPILRTSVDHGTALDLAGSGRADPGSLEAAIDLAADLAWSSLENASDSTSSTTPR
jgi:4-hydroxythreonine-4-phosphate dehydrogenase